MAQKAIDRFYELLILKGEYQDIYGLAYVGDAVKKELRGEIQIVIKDAQILEAPVIKGEQRSQSEHLTDAVQATVWAYEEGEQK